MPWVKLDDGFFRHRKVVQAGRDARDLDLASWCFASGSLSDGFIPREALRQLAADAGVSNPVRLAQRLVDVGLWEMAPNGYRIHDYLDFNPTRERVLATRAARADAGKVGGQRSGDARRERPHQPEITPEEKQRAANVANSALKAGRLTAQPCEGCGRSPAQMHHKDYRRPLDVTWLCAGCHANEHVRLRSDEEAPSEQIASSVASHGLREPTKQNQTPSHVPSTSPRASPSPEHPEQDTDTGGETHTGRTRALAHPDSFEAEFEQFWQRWPKRDGRKVARLAYEKRRKAGRSAEVLLTVAGYVADHCETEGTEMRFRPGAGPFLNQERDTDWEHGSPIAAGPPTRALATNGHRPPTTLERNLANLASLDDGEDA